MRIYCLQQQLVFDAWNGCNTLHTSLYLLLSAATSRKADTVLDLVASTLENKTAVVDTAPMNRRRHPRAK